MARLYAATLFLSALLLFSVQPLIARMLLPSLGGTPVVWNTAMVFFQGVLVLGYLWAHLSLKWFGLRRQPWAHLALLGVAFVALPLAIEPSVEAADGPIRWLLTELGVAVALPFFAISAIAPMLQRWFAAADNSDDPYWLYAASNLGSFAALLGYPFVAEPFFGIETQSWIWTCGYGLLVVSAAACAWQLLRSGGVAEVEEPAPALAWSLRLRWVAMAAIPASLLISVTTFITTDLASVPLLWVVPLAIYLLSFVVVFARRQLISPEMIRAVVVVTALPFFALLSFDIGKPIWASAAIHLAVFAAVCLLFHGRIARERPPVGNLTEFYIWMSVGGVVGGAFSSIVAPFIFDGRWEYPIVYAIALVWLGRQAREDGHRWRWAAAGAAAGLLAAVMFIVGGRLEASSVNIVVVGFFVGMVLAGAAMAYTPSRGMMATAAAGLMATIFVASSLGSIERRRSHLANYSVAEKSNDAGEFHVLYQGRVRHGAQAQDPRIKTLPLAYYHPDSPIGDVFGEMRSRGDTRPVGVVGLGIGALASYALPGQPFVFYEIDPAVVELARDERYFTFLSSCPGECDVVIGDGRIALGEVPDKHFQILVLDAYNSDSIPMHLMTTEAMATYISKVADDGVVVFHVSNTFLDVGRVVMDVAAHSGYRVRSYHWWPRQAYLYELQVNASHYVAVGRTDEALEGFTTAAWSAKQGDPDGVVWTDDFANILSIYRWE